MLRAITFFILACFILPLHLLGETADEAIVRATAAMQAATPRAQADPSHPLFHVISPAQWMNDPNGPIYYKGYYHLFYQLTPYSADSGVKYWGHARSKNLVKWETCPSPSHLQATWAKTPSGRAAAPSTASASR
jgi:hypothetical protein